MSNMKKKEFLKMAVRLMMSRQRKLSPMEKRQHKRNHGFKKPVSESILAQQKYGNRSIIRRHKQYGTHKKILLKIERFNQSQWLFVSVFTTSSGLWFPFIITYLGSPLRLLTRDSNGVVHWKPLGIIITVLTIFWSFISILAKRYSEYRNNANDFPDNGDNLFESVLDAICKV